MKKLEDLLNLPPEKGEEEETEEQETMPVELSATNAITVEEKIEHALSLVSDIDEHDAEMDDIAKRALEAYEEIKEFGMNSSEPHAGKLLDTAMNMLRTAMEAKSNKAKRKLDTIDLQLKKLKIEKSATKETSAPMEGGQFDRNDLIKMLKEDNTNKE